MGVYIWNKLPSEYQEVEYIGRNGNNYIDTGWIPKLTSPFEVKAGYKISTSGARYGVLSNYNATPGEAGLTSLEINDGSHTNNVLRFYSERTSGSNSANIYSSNTLNLSGFNDIVYTNNGSSSGSVTLNGITTNGSVKTDGYSNLTAYLFIDRALRWSTYSSNSFISYCKIYENGTLVRDFVPCYRKSDSVIGMYDLVNNQFYTNSGSGTFTKGSDVNNYHEKEMQNAYIGEVIECDFTKSDYGFTYSSQGGNLNSYGRDSNGFYARCTSGGDTAGGVSWKVPSSIYSRGTLKRAEFVMLSTSSQGGGGLGTGYETKRMRHYTSNRVVWGTQNNYGSLENPTANTEWKFTVDLENKLVYSNISTPNITLALTDNAISAFNTDWTAGNVTMHCIAYSNGYTYIKSAIFYF